MNNRKIVFFIQNFSRPAGSERVTSIIANELSKKGFDVTILSICGDNACFYPLEEDIKLVTLFSKPKINNRKMFLKILFKLKKFYQECRPNLIIDIFPALSIYTLLLKNKYHYKNISWEHFNYKVNTGMNRLGRKLAVRFSDYIITLTKKDCEYYKKANPQMKVRINYIYNPSPFQEKNLDEKERENIIISVGRLTNQKGFDRLLKVWKKFDNHDNWKLFILGEGEEEEKLKKQIKDLELSNVYLPGAVSNVQEYYKRSKIYVSTARYEGLPMTMIEAQTFGLPIVSFDYDTGPDDIIHQDVDGVLIKNLTEDESIENMANILNFLTNHPEKLKEYSINAEISSKRFETKNITEKWLDVLKELEI